MMIHPKNLFFLLLFSPLLSHGALPTTGDYSKGAMIAQDYNRPMLLLFTGSDWCAWSKKLLTEVFNNHSFEETLGTNFVIVQADFPEANKNSGQILQQNQTLKEKFGVTTFPTVLMLDPLGREITRVGYMAGDPKKYAVHLKDLFVKYASLHHEVDHLNAGEVPIAKVEDWYQKACELRCPHYMNQLLDIGVTADQGIFFPLEKYTALLKEKQGKTQLAENLKTKIIERDPDNKEGARLRLALLDFQANEEIGDAAIEPLGQYIASFGGADKENVWRLHLIISEFFSDRGDTKQAKEYAEKSLQEAPEESVSTVKRVLAGI